MVSRLKSPNKKQLPTKHFMSPTISAASRANFPKRKILTERDDTLDVVEQNSVLRWSSSLRNDDVSLKPYDPVENYLSPRPKFLRYNPNRRRNVSVFKGNGDEDSVKSSISSLDVDSGVLPSSGLELGVDSIGSLDSCSNKESADEVENEVDGKSESDEDEGYETEDEDENEDEMVEFEENRCLSWKGFFKFLFVVMAVIVTTQAISSMNLPTGSQTLESVWSLNGSYNNVYGSASSNLCEVEFHPVKEADLVVYEGLGGIDEVVIEEVENDDTDHLQRTEILQEIEFAEIEAEREVYEFRQATDHLQQIEVLKEQEIAESEVMEIDNVEAESEVYDSKQEDTDYLQQIEVLQEQQIEEIDVIETVDEETESEVYDITQVGLVEEDDTGIDESDSQLTAEAEYKIAEETKTLAFITGLSILILTFFSVVYRSKRSKSSTSSFISKTLAQEKVVAEKQEMKSLNLAPIQNDKSTEPLVNTESLQNVESKEISYIHAPSVELLGEFVFGEEVTSSVKSYNLSVPAEDDTSNSLIQPTTVSSVRTKLSQMEMSTGDSHTIKKQKRKNTDSTASSIITPSPVRRSSRIRSQSITSP